MYKYISDYHKIENTSDYLQVLNHLNPSIASTKLPWIWTKPKDLAGRQDGKQVVNGTAFLPEKPWQRIQQLTDVDRTCPNLWLFSSTFPLQFHNVSISWASAALSELFRYVSSSLRLKSHLFHSVTSCSYVSSKQLWPGNSLEACAPSASLHSAPPWFCFRHHDIDQFWVRNIPQPNWVPAFHEAVFAVLTHLLEKSIKLPSWVRLKFTRVLNEWNDPNS